MICNLCKKPGAAEPRLVSYTNYRDLEDASSNGWWVIYYKQEVL